MSKTFWTSTPAPQQFKTLPPARPHMPCRDPEIRDHQGNILHEGHRVLRSYLWEYRDRVCLWCDPEHANAWGKIDTECLYEEQRELIQKLRDEEKEFASLAKVQ